MDPLLVEREALRLEKRAFVPIELKPFEGLSDRFDRLGGRSFSVCILDPEDELATVMAGKEVVKEGGARSSNVEISSGAGSKTRADYCHIFTLTGSRQKSQRRLPSQKKALDMLKYLVDNVDTFFAVTPEIREKEQ